MLPFDFTREVPSTAWKWLLQFGLPWTYWQEIVGYSPSEERLIFRINYPLTVGSIGRYIGADAGKPKWKTRGLLHKHCEVVNPSLGNFVVLVEDLVSAHKVGQITTAIPLFGTQIHPPHYYFIKNDPRQVVLWLDDDQKGRSIMHKAIGMQSVLGRPVLTITTKEDPKLLKFEDIKRTLE